MRFIYIILSFFLNSYALAGDAGPVQTNPVSDHSSVFSAQAGALWVFTFFVLCMIPAGIFLSGKQKRLAKKVAAGKKEKRRIEGLAIKPKNAHNDLSEFLYRKTAKSPESKVRAQVPRDKTKQQVEKRAGVNDVFSKRIRYDDANTRNRTAADISFSSESSSYSSSSNDSDSCGDGGGDSSGGC